MLEQNESEREEVTDGPKVTVSGDCKVPWAIIRILFLFLRETKSL